MASIPNGSFASPLAHAQYPIVPPSTPAGLVARVYNGRSAFSLLVTAFLLLIAYDQRNGKSWIWLGAPG